MRRELCSSGFVLGTWSGWVGTCNSLTRMLTGALLAVALDRPYVHHTNVYDRMQDHSRLGPRTRVFNASLEEAVSGVGGMAWLLPPRCIEETNLISQHWRISPHSVHTHQLATDIVRWCGEANATIKVGDVGAIDLRSPANHGPPFGSFDLKIMMARGAEGVCANAERARIVVAHTDPVPNFELLAANRALPPTAMNRIRALTTRGVNAYGMMQRALYPRGLTRVETVGQPTLAVHLRCWMNACTEHTLKRAAACIAVLVNSSGPGCSIYIASDHVGMADVLSGYLNEEIASRCATLHAASIALKPTLQKEVDTFLSEHLHNKSSKHFGGWWSHAATTHGKTSRSSHPAPWADPVDLAMLSSAETVLGVHSGHLSSTMAYVAGTRTGRYFYVDSDTPHKDFASRCPATSTIYPSSPDVGALSFMRDTARSRALCPPPKNKTHSPPSTKG